MTYEKKETIWFVYDGECPICQMGASLYKVRQSVGEIITINGRTETDHPVMIEINDAQLNLDVGMVIKYHDTLYQGAKALHLMANLGADEGYFNRINNKLHRSQFRATICYPFMRAARDLALFLKGAGRINNLKAKNTK